MASSPATKRIDYPTIENRWQPRGPHGSRHSGGDVADERSFVRVIRLERKRTQRSSTRFMLMVLDGEELFHAAIGTNPLGIIASAVSNCTRETDTFGWFEQGTKLGIVFTEIGAADNIAISRIVERVTVALQNALVADDFKRLKVTLRVFPEDSSTDSPPLGFASAFYADVSGGAPEASPKSFELEPKVEIESGRNSLPR